MAYIFFRGAYIPFNQTFYDSTGGVIRPTSVTVAISYPSSGWPLRTSRETTTLSLTENSTTYEWEGSWNSRNAFPGKVQYHIYPSGTTLDIVDGEFELRANSANLATT